MGSCWCYLALRFFLWFLAKPLGDRFSSRKTGLNACKRNKQTISTCLPELLSQCLWPNKLIQSSLESLRAARTTARSMALWITVALRGVEDFAPLSHCHGHHPSWLPRPILPGPPESNHRTIRMHKGELGVPMMEDTHRYRQLTRDRTKSAAGQSFISNVQTQTHQGHINKRKHKSEEISSLQKKNSQWCPSEWAEFGKNQSQKLIRPSWKLFSSFQVGFV